MSGKNNKNSQHALDPHRVGCIRLTRVLEMRPRALEQMVREMEDSPAFVAVRPCVHVGQVMETTLAAGGRAGRGRALPVAWFDEAAAFLDTSVFLGRRYGFETEVSSSLAPPAAGFFQQMWVIHSRNLLTARSRGVAHMAMPAMISPVADRRRYHPVVDRWRETERQVYPAFRDGSATVRPGTGCAPGREGR